MAGAKSRATCIVCGPLLDKSLHLFCITGYCKQSLGYCSHPVSVRDKGPKQLSFCDFDILSLGGQRLEAQLEIFCLFVILLLGSWDRGLEAGLAIFVFLCFC